MRDRTAELTEANEEIQRFAYIVSHDLRAPLVNIMGFTSEMEAAAATLRRVRRPRRRARSGRQPRGGARSARGHPGIDRLHQDLGRQDGPPDRRHPEAVARGPPGAERRAGGDAAAAGGIAASLQHQAEARGAEFKVGTLPDVVSDRLVLEQVFSNLLENALKYGKPGRPGRIVVSGRASGRMAAFTVEDNGRGIAGRDLERVFELFRRAGDQSVPGEGIGLAHVRALVRRLGGRIDCVSREDVGSTFRVEIPRSGGVADPVKTREHAEP